MIWTIFFLRYGIEDVGQYTADAGTVGTYYGVLAVYGAEPFSAEEQTKAFGKILWDAYCFGKIEGTDHGVPDTYGQESTYFALYDVDGDGQEELLLNWTGASMADTVEYIWGYGDNGTHVELCEFPALTCYDNGVIEAQWSHNQGLAGEFWTHIFYTAIMPKLISMKSVAEQMHGIKAWQRRRNREKFFRTISMQIKTVSFIICCLPTGMETMIWSL